MKNKGFTIVELLGVFIVFVIIMSIAVLGIGSVINTGKKGVYKNHEATSRGAAENYLVDNTDNIPKSGNFLKIPLYYLIDNEYLKELKDPNNGTCDYDESYVAILRGNDTNDNYDLTYYTCLVFKDKDGNVTYKSSGCDEDFSAVINASCYGVREGHYNYRVKESLSSEAINACVNFISDRELYPGETAEAFCNGTGTLWGKTFKESLENNTFNTSELSYFYENNLIDYDIGSRIANYDSSCGSSVIIPKTIAISEYTLNSNLTDEELNNCVFQFRNYFFPSPNERENFCQGTGKFGEFTLQNMIDNESFNNYMMDTLLKLNIINSTSTNRIYPTTIIGESAFEDKNIISVEIPNGVKSIVYHAFYNNNISRVKIPSSVTHLDCKAFDEDVIIEMENPIECYETQIMR